MYIRVDKKCMANSKFWKYYLITWYCEFSTKCQSYFSLTGVSFTKSRKTWQDLQLTSYRDEQNDAPSLMVFKWKSLLWAWDERRGWSGIGESITLFRDLKCSVFRIWPHIHLTKHSLFFRHSSIWWSLSPLLIKAPF